MTKILEGEILPPEPERPTPERSDRADSLAYMLMGRQMGKTRMLREQMEAYRKKPPRPVN